MSHIRVNRDGELIGAAQVKIKNLPGGKGGIADVLNGPLWRKKGTSVDVEVFRELVREIRQEYAVRRGLFVRIRSTETGANRDELRDILAEEGYGPTSAFRPAGPYLLDLSPSLEEIRKNFARRWRRSLNQSEKVGMNVRWSQDQKDFDSFRRLYDEMFVRKKCRPRESVERYWRMHEQFSDDLKFHFLISELDGEPVSINVCSHIGEAGLVLFRANGFKAMETRSSFLLCWHMIQRLKEEGFRYYDCGNARAPSLITYKEGLGAKRVDYPQPHVTGDELIGRVCGTLGQRAQELTHEVKGAIADLGCRVGLR
ncbi:MAG: GNAT family N-acetyltransferase [Verrucomicrobiota bacterium]